MGDKLKVLYFSLDFFSKLHQQKNISAAAYVNANLFYLFNYFTFRKFFECTCCHAVTILMSAIHMNLRSLFFELSIFALRVLHFLILSHCVASCGGLV